MDGNRSCDEDQTPLIEPEVGGHGQLQLRQHRPIRSFCAFALLLVVSLLVLSSIPLSGLVIPSPSLSSPSSPASPASPSPPSPSLPSVSSSSHGDAHEEIPSHPRLRDTSEYILDPSWDASAPPTTRTFNWTITDARLNPDGVFRPMMLINNQFPGPLVQLNEDDTLVVHIHNLAANATSVHFHGLFQNGTNWMDGAVGITQCAIAPGSSFIYRFSVRGQSGTFWYHAHHSSQASDGLLGPVIVHPRLRHQDQVPGAPAYDTDRIVMVQDHYHNTSSELLMDYLKPDAENAEPVPDNALINGRGIRNCADFPGWQCEPPSSHPVMLDLAAGQRHRLRFINVGAFAEFQIQIDEHPFSVVEVDATAVHPADAFHRLNILPAQRYSIVVEANVTTARTFWMRARMVTHCFATKNPRLEPEARAIIRYTSPDSASTPSPTPDPIPHSREWPEPNSSEWPDPIEVVCRDLNVSSLRPVIPLSPPPADDFIPLVANFMIGDWRLSRGFFNDSSWRPNATHPSLHRFLDANGNSSTTSASSPTSDTDIEQRMTSSLSINNIDFPSHELVLQTTGIRTVDLAINNFDDGAHPFHLHGHTFHLLAQGRSGYPPNQADLADFLARNNLAANPLRRDTVSVEGYGWVIVRVVLDNPGLWALHCHNAWHMEAGMLMQLLVRSDQVARWTLPQQHRDTCRRQGVDAGMRPDDSIWFGHFDT